MKNFFISYNSADNQWAQWIAWQLEEAGYTTVIQAWDFRPGSNFILEMQRAATEAERTIAVLSPDYLGARFPQSEWAAAFVQDPTGLEGTPLPVRVRECQPKGLLRPIVSIDLVGLEEAAAKDALLAGVRQERAKPTAAPGFPGGTVPRSVPEQPRFPGTLPPVQKSSLVELLAAATSGRQPRGCMLKFAMYFLVLLVIGGILILSKDDLLVHPTPTTVAILHTDTPTPTYTFTPTSYPVYTPYPTYTQVPTDTPVPLTRTPTPAATSMSTPTPTSTPMPLFTKWVILRSIPAPRSGPTGLVRVGDNIWVSIPGEGRLYRLDLEGNLVAELDLPTDCPYACKGGLAWDGNHLWFAIGKSVYQLDPLSGQGLDAFEVDLDAITGITWDGEALLVVDNSGNLVRYDRAGQQLRQLAIRSPHGEVTGMAWVNEELWVVGIFGDLLRFNSGFEEVGSFNLSQCTAAKFPYYLALHWDGNSLWVVDFEGARLSQCAPITTEGARYQPVRPNIG